MPRNVIGLQFSKLLWLQEQKFICMASPLIQDLAPNSGRTACVVSGRKYYVIQTSFLKKQINQTT